MTKSGKVLLWAFAWPEGAPWPGAGGGGGGDSAGWGSRCVCAVGGEG